MQARPITEEGQSPKLLTRLLAGLSLVLLVANVIRDYRGGWLPGIGRTQGSAPTGSQQHARRGSTSLTVRLAAHRPERSQRAAGQPKPRRATVPTISAPTSLTLRPLGYVEQPDGKKIAVLPQGEHVALVPEGEVFGGRYRAMEVSAQAVTLRDELGAVAGKPPPELIAVTGRGAIPENPAPVPAGSKMEGGSDDIARLAPSDRETGAVSRQSESDLAASALPASEAERLLPGFNSEAFPARPAIGPSTRLLRAGPPAHESQRAPPRTIRYGAPPESGPAVHEDGPGQVRLLGVIESVPGQMQAAVEWGGEVCLVKERGVLPEGSVVSKIFPGAMVVTATSPARRDQRRVLVFTCCGYNSSGHAIPP